MHHFVFVFLRFPYQNLVQISLLLTNHTAADVGVDIFICNLVDRYALQLFTEDEVVLDMLILCELLEDEAKDVLELVFVLGFHVTSNVISLDFKLPLKARILDSLLVDGKSNRVHVEMNWQLVKFPLLAVEVDCIILTVLPKTDSAFGEPKS